MLHYAIHYKAYRAALPKHLFLVSFVVFLILNLVENIFHYSIGRDRNEPKLKFEWPDRRDFIRILVVMLIFGLLQAGFTCLFVGC
jgi:hypothetical protein